MTRMANVKVLYRFMFGCVICVLLEISHIAAFSNATDSALESSETNVVPDSCGANDNVVYDVCTSGNRMYRLLQYDVDQTQVLSECYQACSESYSSENDTYSCKVGCQIGGKADYQRQNQLDDFKSSESSILHQAQMQQMLSHWMFELIAGFDVFNDWYDSGDDKEPEQVDSYSTFVVIEQSDNQLRISSYRIDEPRPSRLTTTDTADGPGPRNPYVQSNDEDSESCFTEISYSRWILCMLLLSSGLFLIWLTCSTFTTAPKQRVKEVETEQPDVDDEKLSLKMVLAYHTQVPVPVHTFKKQEDVKMLLA